jgi:DNA helicase-2/ATP-dependent DNA helicase PcrA
MTAKKTIAVCDYKTGKPASSWRGKDDYEKVKLHKYEQQLMFYKLMIEATSRYRSGQVATAAVVFIEPDQSGKVRELPLEWDEAKLRRFKKLIQVVWSHIIQLQLPDTSAYPASYKGILAFEDDLLKT